jgi:glycosyltransferase involved in cell wall biosynthesis
MDEIVLSQPQLLPKRVLVPPKVAVVVPCYRVKNHVLGVIGGVIELVDAVYVVDDACPEGTADYDEASISHPNLRIIRLAENQGVGGAVVSGYRQALLDGCDIVVKMDGDGQMDAKLLPLLVAPIIAGTADYTKGNRFFEIYTLRPMPPVRILGNSLLSFINKISSGYWDVMDPTNGYTAIHRAALRRIPLDRLERRYFFESDMLFRLGTIRAVVQDVPMPSIYGTEKSNMAVWRIAMSFPSKYFVRFLKRFFYVYLLRDFNVGSLETVLGLCAVIGGVIFGAAKWSAFSQEQANAPAGVVMLSALPIILGFQLLLNALTFDIANRPKVALQSLPDEQ